MSISTSRGAITGYEPVLRPAGATAGPPLSPPPKTALFRLRSAQPSRRAVLHLQAAGDPVVPADLAGWFTERACSFYLAGLRLPAGRGLPAPRPEAERLRHWRLRFAPRSSRAVNRACAELDTVRAHLRDADGIEHVIVSAQGRAASLAAEWCARAGRRLADPGGVSGPPRDPADALILYRPDWPPRRGVWLDIPCPVLVLTAGARGRLRRNTRPRYLGAHVTWLRLPDGGSESWLAGLTASASRRAFFDELGRWLGAYMYGQPADQLL